MTDTNVSTNPILGFIAEVRTTQETRVANELLAQGWQLLAVTGTDWPAYALGRLSDKAIEVFGLPADRGYKGCVYYHAHEDGVVHPT